VIIYSPNTRARAAFSVIPIVARFWDCLCPY